MLRKKSKIIENPTSPRHILTNKLNMIQVLVQVRDMPRPYRVDIFRASGSSQGTITTRINSALASGDYVKAIKLTVLIKHALY